MARRLRIAVSVFFALIAVAFAVLWVRSYWTSDFVEGLNDGTRLLVLNSNQGGVGILLATATPDPITFHSIDLKVWRGPAHSNVFRYSGKQRFGTAWDGDVIWIRIPRCLAIAFAGVLLVFVGVGFRPTYSLRTLLIATTLIAFVLGLIVWQARS